MTEEVVIRSAPRSLSAAAGCMIPQDDANALIAAADEIIALLSPAAYC